MAEQNDTQFKSPRIPTISVGSPGSDRVFDSPQVEPSQSNRDLKRPEPFRTSQVQPPLGQNQNNSRPHSDGQLDNDKGKVDSNQSGPKRNKVKNQKQKLNDIDA